MPRKQLHLLGGIVFAVFVFLFVYNQLQGVTHINYGNESLSLSLSNNGTYVSGQKKNEKNDDARKRVILMWTKVFGDTRANFECPYLGEKCEVTFDRQQFEKAEAVVFHIPDLDLHDLPPPPQPGGQRAYVFEVQESASSSARYHKINEMPKNFFHWTMTVLSDSDAPFPYGGYWVAPEEAARHGFPPLNLSYVAKNVVAAKKKAVYWLVSNCHTDSKREIAFSALSRHLKSQIDIIGQCAKTEKMRNFCPRENSVAECEVDLANSYYFYIAAENSNCKDYITEKYWARMPYPAVPIVMRREIYDNKIPPNSFIAMDDFDSPKALADHLQRLMKNPEEYMKYFEWRTKGWAKAPWNTENYRMGLCKVCELLLADKHKSLPEPIEDAGKWFVEKSHCDNGEWAIQWAQKH